MTNPSDPFYEFYKTELLPLLRPIERNRKRKLLKIILQIALVLFFIIAASWYLSGIISTATNVFERESRTAFYMRTLSFIFMGCVISFSFIYFFIKKFYLIDYSIQFKYFILPKLISHIDNILTYFKNEGLSEHFLEMSKLFKKQCGSLYSEDKVEGLIGKTKITMTEFFYKQKDLEGEKRNENYLFIMADFNKHFFNPIIYGHKMWLDFCLSGPFFE